MTIIDYCYKELHPRSYGGPISGLFLTLTLTLKLGQSLDF